MKKLILLLIAAYFFVSGSTTQLKAQTINGTNQFDCTRCNTNLPSEHTIDINKAADMIRQFEDYIRQNNINIPKYGGTIYGDVTYFRDIPDANAHNYPVIKYHFCTDSSTSNNLYLAFEREQCKLSTTPNNYLEISNKTIGDGIKTSDEIFVKVKRRTFGGRVSELRRDNKPYNQDPNTKLRQNIKKEDIEKGVKALKENSKFNDIIPCDLKRGNFNFDNSIHEIFLRSEGKCKGIRYYFGMEGVTTLNLTLVLVLKVILVGVDENGDNLDVYKENSLIE